MTTTKGDCQPDPIDGRVQGLSDRTSSAQVGSHMLTAGRRLQIFVLGALACSAPAAMFAQAPVGPAAYSALEYRYIGPPGNRTIAVAGIPGDPLTYYVGAASGGIWKTIDGGIHWNPIFDDQPVSSIGALAIAPSDSEIIWAGTGETFLRSHISHGWGAFKSVDAGETWEKMGLDSTARIGRIVIHPTNPDIVILAALGHAFGPQQDRGIYRTTDGGDTWDRVLFVDENSGGIDVVMDPNDPNILFAAMWQIEVKTWGRTSGGPGSGIWRSVDGGATWTRLEGNGLPTRPFGKVGLAMSAASSSRVYALIETGAGLPWNGEPTDVGALWRSDDGGETWEMVNDDKFRLLTRPAYYTRMGVAPDNPDETYHLTIFLSSSSDGGETLEQRPPDASPGFDNHDIWIDPTNGDRIAIANDEGISISQTRGRTWHRIRLPIAQIYRVTTDTRVPYTVCGNMQDGPSTCGPSNSKLSDGLITGGADIPRGLWYSVGGGESGTATPDPVDPNIVWSSASGRGSASGIVVRHDLRTQDTRDVEVWPVAPFGHAAADVRYRFVWDFPIAVSPHDNERVYAASQYVHVTVDRGQHWEIISPDLTLNTKETQVHSGGITPDNLGVEYGNAIYSIAESPRQAGLIWVGTNDGLVQITRDGGQTWTNVTPNIPGMISWGTVNNIEPSRHDPGKAYITVNGHLEGNFDPWIYRTEDYGETWELIAEGIPRTPLSVARNVREDPVRPGLLYLATENAMYVSFDDGALWLPLQLNLPPAPVSWLTIQEHFNDLVLSTYGRGFWILDDLSPLQQLTNEVAASDMHLFEPRGAYRFRMLAGGIRAMADDPTAGTNPPYGASLAYWLAEETEDEVQLDVADAAGVTVASVTGTGHAGVNRVTWNLRFGSGGQFGQGNGGPPGRSFRLLAPPGEYQVTLHAAGREHTQRLSVLKDPNSGGTEEDIAAQHALLLELATDIETANDLTTRIDSIRSQLDSLAVRTADDTSVAAIRDASVELERSFTLVADSLVQQKPGGFFMWPVKLTAKLIYLANNVQSSDHAPTDQAREARAFLETLLHVAESEYEGLVVGDLATLNRMLRSRGLPPIVEPGRSLLP